MDSETIVSILRQGLYLVLIVSAGPMAAALMVGLFTWHSAGDHAGTGADAELCAKDRCRFGLACHPWALDDERSRSVFAGDPQLHPYGALMDMLRVLQDILAGLGVHTNIQDFLMLFFLIFIRLVSALNLTPFLGGKALLNQIKVGLSVMIAALLFLD